MAKNLFSIPIFFIVFRETLEAAIVISVLLSLAEQIVYSTPASSTTTSTTSAAANSSNTDGRGSHEGKDDGSSSEAAQVESLPSTPQAQRVLARKLRMQIFLGSGLGLFIALAIGAAFIAVWFTKASDLWSKSEDLWEGIFDLIASLMIFVMSISMLKLDRAKDKWRVKFQRAFSGKDVDGQTKTGKWALFLLPLITVLREGMEAVVFVGGVSLGQPATSIPIAAIVGIICGLVCGFIIYAFASRTTLRVFLIITTNLLLLIGGGLFSRAVWSFERNAFSNLLGAQGDDALGDGPGSFLVSTSVWHLDCCNSENNIDGQGWGIFGSVLGWTNSASVGSVLSYVFWWIAVIAVLIFTKWKEGRTSLFGKKSAAGIRRDQRQALAAEREAAEKNRS